MSRKPDEWMPLDIREYLGDTTHLTRDQHGAYLLLLMAYWMRGCALPAVDRQLATISKCTMAEWRTMKPIIADFFRESDGRWFQNRAERELAKARKIMDVKSSAGKAGADARWNGKRNGKRMAEPLANTLAEGVREQRQNDAPLTNTSLETSVSKPKSADAPFVLPDWVPKPEWEGFIEVRKRAKANPTDHAKSLLVKKLATLRDDGFSPKEIIEAAIENSWKGFYPPPQPRHVNGTGTPNPHEIKRRGTLLALERIAQEE